ncbi:MAG: acetyl-CoA hydrolase/transferase family protein [Gammaproteobacteria bacterium]|nr:MAG: acetyl-CoA hydrolase/transferase family protein [Gammaproteobacteria bacterium]
MNSDNLLKKRLITVDDALSMIQSNFSIVSAMAASEPTGICTRLHEAADRVENVSVCTCLPMQPYKWYMDPAMKGKFFNEGWFYGPAIRKAHKEAGTCSFIPNHLHQAGTDRLYNHKPNIFIGTCTKPDRFGYVSLSLGVTYERLMIEAADTVILEVNENMPRTYGDTIVHMDEIDYLIDNTAPIPELGEVPISDKDRMIGRYIADLIEDGSTIQLGIGGIPNAVAAELMHKKDLSIHTEMFTDGMVDLYEAGVIGTVPRSVREKILTGKMVATFALGTKKLYDFLHENPAVAIMRGDWVNDPYVIAQNHKQVSINTCLEIDLTGQVSSESIGPTQFSGTGGQADTAIGAQKSDGGKSFIALYSTASIKQPDGTRKTVSKIAPHLALGAAVTLHRSNIDHVVTEYGVAKMKGVSIHERAKRLISIAHPDFRDWLEEEAKKVGFIV